MRNKIRDIVIYSILVTACFVTSCSTKVAVWQSHFALYEYKLNAVVFSHKKYVENFAQGNYEIVDPNVDRALFKVGIYNDFVSRVDSSYIVDVHFTFNRKHGIKKVEYFYQNKKVEIVEYLYVNNKIEVLHSPKSNGYYLYVRGMGNHLEDQHDWYIRAGIYKNDHPAGMHFTYNPLDTSMCYIVKEYDDYGKITREDTIRRCNWKN